MKNEWNKISLIFLFLVALIGTFLRSTAFIPIPLKYINLVHAHSHVAFQGWVYTTMILLLTSIYLKENQIKTGRYPLQYILTVIVVIGVLISFSLQGYGLYSIIFSTLFQLLNYWFIYRFLKDSGDINSFPGNAISLRFVKTGLWLGLLSTFMPIGIGILSAKGLSGTEAYQSLVYAFMHLQYNGWFLFVVLGLFFKFLENNNILYNRKYAIKFYWLFAIAVIPATALSLIGMGFSKYIMLPAYFAATLLGTAFLFFIMALPGNLIASLKQKSKWFQLYLTTFLVSFTLKMTLQCLSAFPLFKPYAFNNNSVIVAYLHLSLIGVISFLFIAMMIEMKWLPINRFVKVGSVLLVLGFVTTELLLIFERLDLHYDHVALIIGSATMALGILFLIISPNKKLERDGII